MVLVLGKARAWRGRVYEPIVKGRTDWSIDPCLGGQRCGWVLIKGSAKGMTGSEPVGGGEAGANRRQDESATPAE